MVMKFESVSTWNNLPPKPIELDKLKSMYEDFFVDLILKLKPGEHIECDFRIITRVE